MSLERVITALSGLGLSRIDAEVYVYLAKKGPNKVVALARATNINKQKIYSSLKTLQTKGLVSKDRTTFSALPFEEALDLLIKIEKEQAQAMHESKEKLLATWKTKD
jgi:sugar-specific transcriptional regulator TrmB